MPLNAIQYNINKETSQLAGKAYEDSDYTLAIATLTQMYNNCAETHLCGGVIYDPFCLPVVRFRSTFLLRCEHTLNYGVKSLLRSRI